MDLLKVQMVRTSLSFYGTSSEVLMSEEHIKSLKEAKAKQERPDETE